MLSPLYAGGKPALLPRTVMTSKRPWARSTAASLAAATFFAACSCEKTKESPAGAGSSAAPPGPSASALEQGFPAPMGSRWPKPTGPQFAVLAGQGIGPIRLGAKVATVERHMQAPCEERASGVCRYLGRGVEFFLDGEQRVVRIHLHRVGRRVPSGEFGVFNGAIPPDLQFGMLPEAVQQHLGKPKDVVQGETGGHPGSIEQHAYEGMVLEYDRAPSGQTVLSGIRIPK